MNGLNDSFSSCYRREARYVANAVRSFGVAHDEVEDAVQEVFLVLYRRWAELDCALPVRTWLYGVARRVSGNRRRARARRNLGHLRARERHETDVLPEAPSPRPDDQVAAKQAAGLLQAILTRLPPARRVVYLLTVVDELTAAEVAVRVRRPRNTVSSQLRIARSEIRQLARRLTERAPAASPRRASGAASGIPPAPPSGSCRMVLLRAATIAAEPHVGSSRTEPASSLLHVPSES
jgi:RNA polymerase sigma factor (sigma-70 family)